MSNSMMNSRTENAWRQSEDYFDRIEVQLQQRHEEILARRAALMSGKEAFYDRTSGFPEIFIGSDTQARKRNETLFQNLQSIRHDLHQKTQDGAGNLSRLRKEYLQGVQDSMLQWISQLREFKLRQVQKIGEDRWNADEDYQAIDAIIRYRPSPRGAPAFRGGAPAAAAAASADSFAEAPISSATAASAAASPGGFGSGGGGGRQLAASVPDLSASHQSRASAASAPVDAGGDGGGRRRGSSSRLGTFLSSSWSNLRARMSRGGGGGRNRQPR